MCLVFNPLFISLMENKAKKKEKAENISFLISLFIGIFYSFWVYSYNVENYVLPLFIVLGTVICALIYKLTSCLIMDLF